LEEVYAYAADQLQRVIGNKSMNSSLVPGKRAFAVECPSAILYAAEERHLLCGTKQRTMHLALMTIEIPLVLKAAPTVSILANMGSNVSRILVNTISSFKVGIH